MLYKPAALSTCLVLLAGILFSPLACAHTLPETSAKITLRDGQLEARLWVDLSKWRHRLQSSELWLLGDIPKVLAKDATEQQTLDWMQQLLLTQLHIKLDEVAIVFELVHFPSEFAQGAEHHRAEIVIFSKHSQALPRQLQIRYPASLGKVHNSISKPRYKLAKPGEIVKVTL